MEIITKIKNKLEEIKKLTTKEILNYLKIFAFTLLIVVFFTILFQICIGNAEKTIGLISALGILISALLASYSVMLNIENIKQMKIEEINSIHNKNLIYLIFLLNSTKNDLEYFASYLHEFIQLRKEKREFLQMKKNYMFKIIKSLESVRKELLTKDIVFILRDDDEKLIKLKDIIDTLEGLEVMTNDIFNDKNDDGKKFVETLEKNCIKWVEELLNETRKSK